MRIPLAVIEHLPHLHGAELKVLLVLGCHQARGGGRDKKPFPYSIPQIMEDTGLCPRAISQAISRLAKHHLILRVKKHGALPNRYRVLLEAVAPKKIPNVKKPARTSRRPEPAQAVEVNVPEPAAVPQKRAGGRRRKDSRPLLVVEIPNLFIPSSATTDEVLSILGELLPEFTKELSGFCKEHSVRRNGELHTV